MTPDGRPLFRPEAVEHHARGRLAERPLDFGERRTTFAFRALVLAVAACVGVTLTVHADVSARGTGTVLPGGVTAGLALPVGALGRLHPGQAVHLDLGSGDARGTVTRVGSPQALPDGVMVPVSVALDRPETAGAHGTAIVRLGRPTLAALLLGKRGG